MRIQFREVGRLGTVRVVQEVYDARLPAVVTAERCVGRDGDDGNIITVRGKTETAAEGDICGGGGLCATLWDTSCVVAQQSHAGTDGVAKSRLAAVSS